MRPKALPVPRLAVWLAAIHLALVGTVLTWASLAFAATPIGQAMPLPTGLRWGLAVQEVADWPTNWLTVRIDQVVPLPLPVALATPVALGTIQWFLVGLLAASVARRFRRDGQVQ